MNDLLAGIAANPIVNGVILGVAVGGSALWLLGAWWAYADMSRRSESEVARLLAAAWILVSTPIFLPVSLLVYALVRPHSATAERRARELVIALALARVGERCGCGAAVDPGWRRCPVCTSWLAVECGHCGEWSAPAFEICPACAFERHEPAPEQAETPDPETTPAWVPLGAGGLAGHRAAAALLQQ